MPFIHLENGLTLHYLDFAPAPTNQGIITLAASAGAAVKPIVLLHGLGAHSYSWLMQFPSLTRAGLRVIAPDFRGYGASSFPNGELSLDILAEDLEQLLQALHLDTVGIVGVSLGGMLALQHSIRYPERVNRLVLVNTSARVRPTSLAQARYYAARLFSGLVHGRERRANLVASSLFQNKEDEFFRKSLVDQILAADHRAYQKTILSLVRYDLVKELKSIKAETLVITGKEDTTISPKLQGEVAFRIPGARQIIVSDAGHALPVEQFDRLNSILLDFFCTEKNLPNHV